MQRYDNLRMFLRIPIWKDIQHLFRTPQLDRGIGDDLGRRWRRVPRGQLEWVH